MIDETMAEPEPRRVEPDDVSPDARLVASALYQLAGTIDRHSNQWFGAQQAWQRERQSDSYFIATVSFALAGFVVGALIAALRKAG
jgi:hypothetical protein